MNTEQPIGQHHEFSGDWLSLREPADHAARPARLAEQLNLFFAGRTTLRIVDLGAGHGNNLRWLAPRLEPAQHWLSVDRDRRLLAQARQYPRPAAAACSLETLETDLADTDFGFLAGCDLVTASALFDIVSADWIQRLVTVCQAQACATLFALSVTGEWGFMDADGQALENEDDTLVCRLFNRHQRQDKGLGAALGPEAARRLPEILDQAGFTVRTAASDWQLRAGTALARGLGTALLRGWLEAAVEAAPEQGSRLAHWHHQRGQDLACGRLGVRVGHLDVLGLPPS